MSLYVTNWVDCHGGPVRFFISNLVYKVGLVVYLFLLVESSYGLSIVCLYQSMAIERGIRLRDSDNICTVREYCNNIWKVIKFLIPLFSLRFLYGGSLLEVSLSGSFPYNSGMLQSWYQRDTNLYAGRILTFNGRRNLVESTPRWAKCSQIIHRFTVSKLGNLDVGTSETNWFYSTTIGSFNSGTTKENQNGSQGESSAIISMRDGVINQHHIGEVQSRTIRPKFPVLHGEDYVG